MYTFALERFQNFNFFFFLGMTTKFNQGMYAQIRLKKNEPLSNLGTKNVKVTDKGASVTSAISVTPGIEIVRTASPTTFVEEIPSQWKRQRAGDKDKEKSDSRSSNVWGDARVMMARAQEIFTSDEMKIFSGSFPGEFVGRHLHKLIQVMYLCKFNFSFTFCLHCS